LKILQEENCGVDCASEIELLMSHKLGFEKQDIMFSSNDTPAQEFQYARKLDATINLDAYEHVAFLKMSQAYLRLFLAAITLVVSLP
jgi:diaminopimelate decarboxylase